MMASQGLHPSVEHLALSGHEGSSVLRALEVEVVKEDVSVSEAVDLVELLERERLESSDDALNL